jgi:uncharacterized protein with HEPN domain
MVTTIVTQGAIVWDVASNKLPDLREKLHGPAQTDSIMPTTA